MATLDFDKNRLGSKRPVIPGLSLDDSNDPVNPVLRVACSNVSEMDATLLEAGYKQSVIDVMNVNDKIFNLRVLDAENRLPDIHPEPDPEPVE